LCPSILRESGAPSPKNFEASKKSEIDTKLSKKATPIKKFIDTNITKKTSKILPPFYYLYTYYFAKCQLFSTFLLSKYNPVSQF